MGDPVRLGMAQRVWSLVAIAALVVGIVGWWAPRAEADTPLGTTGETANNFLFDEAGQPGAACVLDPETLTVRFTVTAPYVVGLNRDPEFVEATAVRWNVILLQDDVVIDESDRQYGSAGEISGATFDPIEIVSPVLTGLLSIQIAIQWLDFPEMPAETVLGSSLRQVDYYSQNLNDDTGARTVEDGCRVAEVPTPVPTDTPAPTSTPIPPTATTTPEPTATVTPEPTATNTPEPTATNTPAPAATSTPGPAATSTPSATSTATPSPTPTLTPAPSAAPSTTPVPSNPPNGPATVTTSASRGIVNSNLRITLSGFPANSYTEISFSGATVAALTTTAEGTGRITIKVPAKPAGTYPLWASSGAESASASYTIAPRVKVIPGSAAGGDQVEVSLRGFGRNEAVRIRWLVDGRWVEVGFVPRTSNTGSANILVTVPADADLGPTSVRGDGPLARAQTNAVYVTE